MLGAGWGLMGTCLGTTRTAFGFCDPAGELAGDAFCAFNVDAIVPRQIKAKTKCFTVSLTAFNRFLFGGFALPS